MAASLQSLGVGVDVNTTTLKSLALGVDVNTTTLAALGVGVELVNSAPSAAPSNGGAWSVDEAAPLAETIAVDDADGDAVAVALVGAAPAWMTFKIGAANVDLSGATYYPVPFTIDVAGTPPQTGAGSHYGGSPYSFDLLFDDAEDDFNVPISVDVNNVNQPETIDATPAPPYAAAIGVPITPIDIDVDDADFPDALDVSLDEIAGSLPPGLSYSEALPFVAPPPYTVQITGTPTAPGSYSATLEADDGDGATAIIVLDFEIAAPAEGEAQLSSIIGPVLTKRFRMNSI